MVMKDLRKIYIKNFKQADSKTVNTLKSRNLHGSLQWILIMAQCMGQMPVCGVSKPDFRFLKFTWKSWRCFYCILNCVGSGFVTVVCICRALLYGINLYQSTALAFHFSTMIMTLLFLKLAVEWPQLMRNWGNVEISMRKYGWPKCLHTRISIMAIAVLSVAAVEWTLDKVSWFLIVTRCPHKLEDIFKYYFSGKLYPQIFAVVSYSLWKGILLQIVNILGTFSWTFTDLFIMLMSTALALRFQQVTERLQVLRNSKTSNVEDWTEIREDYNRLSKLTRSLDDALSYIVLISFASNLFFVLTQFFHSLRQMNNTLEKVYFFFSFGFLILRTICVSLYGAWIYDESKQPAAVLNSVSSDVYNIEIKRFIEQVKYDTVALTGKQFFCVTRGLILSMAGAIVTYELVLIQFNANLLEESALLAKNSSKC